MAAAPNNDHSFPPISQDQLNAIFEKISVEMKIARDQAKRSRSKFPEKKELFPADDDKQ